MDIIVLKRNQSIVSFNAGWPQGHASAKKHLFSCSFSIKLQEILFVC